jgi:redox-sensing transcriptional repressor
VALFDTDPAKVGTRVGDLTVSHYDQMREIITEQDVVVAVLALPSSVAQSVADDLVEVGVRVLFNYSEALLQTPPEVTVHASSPAVDLLYALYFYLA